MLPAAPGSFLVIVGAAILAVVTCSTPIIKKLSFLTVDLSGVQVSGHSLSGEAAFGCLGYCVAGTCSSPKLGYTFDLSHVLSQLGAGSDAGHLGEKLSSGILKGLTYTMVLHPIAAGIAAAAGVFGLFSMCDGCMSPCLSGILTGLASTIACLAFAFDLATFLILKNRIHDADSSLNPKLGAAVWVALAGWIVILLGSCGLGAGLCRARRYYADRHRQRADDISGGTSATPYGQGMPLGRVSSSRSRRGKGLWRKHDDASSDEEVVATTKYPDFAMREDEGLLKMDHDDFATTSDSLAHPGAVYPGGASAAAHGPSGSAGGYGDPYAVHSDPYAQAYPYAAGAGYAAHDPTGTGYAAHDPAYATAYGYADPSATAGYADTTGYAQPYGPHHDQFEYQAYPDPHGGVATSSAMGVSTAPASNVAIDTPSVYSASSYYGTQPTTTLAPPVPPIPAEHAGWGVGGNYTPQTPNPHAAPPGSDPIQSTAPPGYDTMYTYPTH